MGEPLAYLLTFRTYGTWLHGDERGSVDRGHNQYGAPLLHPDPQRAAREANRMRHRPMELSETMRSVVDVAIRDQCRYRNWEVMELSVGSNHVHILVGYAGVKPEVMAGQVKARATRWLREQRLVAPAARVWADHAGSTAYLWRTEQVKAAAAYVREGQDVPH